MGEVGAAIEEYKSVRQERLEALARQQAVAQYGLATGGVAVGVALLAAKSDQTGAAVVVLMILIPLTGLFGALMLATEAQRVARAGWYLRGLESRINGHLPADAEPLGWETLLASDSVNRVQGYVALSVVVILTIGVLSIGFGGALLARDGDWMWFAGGVVADTLFLVALALWSHRVWGRLRGFQNADSDPAGPGDS
jgi:hypothetical protein